MKEERIDDLLKWYGKEFPPKEGEFVYFYRLVDGHPTKIGYTANTESRLLSFSTSCPYDALEVVFIPGQTQLERALHERFSDTRLHGEWFVTDEAMLCAIESAKRQAGAMHTVFSTTEEVAPLQPPPEPDPVLMPQEHLAFAVSFPTAAPIEDVRPSPYTLALMAILRKAGLR